MPLIHLPVQSGSNKILNDMNRKHSVEEYLLIVKKLKQIKPNIKFSSDFIIGYPGETSEDFHKTLKLMNEIKFINSFSYIFSARPGTPAFDIVDENQKDAKERLIKFQTIADKIKKEYRESLKNKISSVLIENKIENEKKYFGRDEYFNSVIVKSNDNLVGKIIDVKILESAGNTLYGKNISNLNQKNCAA